MMVDVDHFKRFNDNFGHDAGDAVLKAVAQALNGGMRRGDITCAMAARNSRSSRPAPRSA